MKQPRGRRALRSIGAAGALGALAVQVATAVVACAPRSTGASGTRAPASAHGAPSPAPAVEKAETAPHPAEDAGAVVAAALAETSRVRELGANGPVRGVALAREQMARQVEATIEREVPPDVVTAQTEMLVALGAAKPDFDYMKATMELMSSELAGYYDPADKTMYLASDLGEEERAATLSHELVHALQDQHYDLGKQLEYRPDQSDAQSAVHAFAEGDATSAMLDQILAPRQAKATDLPEELLGVQVRAAMQLSTRNEGVPEILKRSLVAPYIDGIGLVHWLRRRGGWGEVDRVWKEPPVSTEQLLHPEKLIAREQPVTVAVPVAPEKSWPPSAYTDVFGEQALRLLLEEWLPRKPAAEAASGWGGDRLAVYRDGSRFALAVHLVYDDAASAARGSHALEHAVDQQQPGGGALSRPRKVCAERGGTGPLLVAHQGRDVVLVAGPYVRTGVTVASAGSCRAAADWARRILVQRPSVKEASL